MVTKGEISTGQRVVIASTILAVGLLFLILACVLVDETNFYPLLMLLPAFLIPTFLVLCSSVSGTSDYGGPSGFQNTGEFIAGTMFVSYVAIPIVFHQLDIINSKALAYSLASVVSLLGAAGFYGWVSSDDDGYA